VKEDLHAPRGVLHALEVIAAILAERRRALDLEAVAECLDLAQRLLEIVEATEAKS